MPRPNSEEINVAGATVEQHKNVLHTNIWYPRHNQINTIQVGLYDVRAADDIQISYDFDRDGWVVKQASTFQWDADDEVCNPDWQEVAFIQAWGRAKHEEDDGGGICKPFEDEQYEQAQMP